MAENITERVGRVIAEAIAALPVLEAAKERICWDVFPFIDADLEVPTEKCVYYMISVGVLVPGSGDHLIHHQQILDPYGDDVIRSVVNVCYSMIQPVADQLQQNVKEVVAGTRPPSRLIIPPGR
jgi:hypothetical protein